MKPYLKNGKTNKVEKAVTRRLTIQDLDALVQLQQDTVSALDDPSIYLISNREDFADIINDTGEIYGIFTRDRLCGACSIYMPGNTPQNLGRDIGLEEKELPSCATLDSVFVSPDYRNNGIARELIHICIKRAVDAMGANYVLATVSPKNIASILSFLSLNNMRLKTLRQKYGCRLRYIMCYKHNDKRLYTIYERYAIEDVFSISRALADGYEGIATFKNEDNVYIWLAK